MSARQYDARQAALQAVIAGQKTPNSAGVVNMGGSDGRDDFFVQLELQDEDLIFTILAEFGPTEGPDYPRGGPGPVHNEIAEPDRSVDNTTIWVDDFNRNHYLEILFSERRTPSVRSLYLEMSSGRYTVSGDVTDWVEVPYNHAHYGGNEGCSFGDCNIWDLVNDGADAWYQSMVDAGWSDAQINDYLSQFDVWDRYDWDLDGNFDEPDGYIDHFQIVHAGEGEEAGGGAQGADAIWSHRWYADFTTIGVEGPSPDYLIGGQQIGNSGYWIGDYTVEPENGGVGVFAHEYAHDLGLPDLYDTSGGENSTGFWTLMSSGSWLGEGTEDIGSRPNHMGAWEKLQLGWLDYSIAFPGDGSEHVLTPSMGTTLHGSQALIVILPEKDVTTNIGTPYEGSFMYYSGSGDNLDNFMYTEVTTDGTEHLTAMVNYDIEVDWDYAYVVYSDDGGASWTSVDTDHSDNAGNPNGQDFGYGISGSTGGSWASLTTIDPLPAGDLMVGFRYWTDVAVANPGIMIDNIQIGAGPIAGAEMDDGYTLDGFRVTDGVETVAYPHYYFAVNRQPFGYDRGLKTGPYNFGFLDNPALGNYVEHFSYQRGMLVSYWDTSQTDNNTNTHPGQGLILPIDAHPDAMIRADGQVWRSRVQTYDSTFSKWRTQSIALHWLSQPSYHRSQPGVPVFDDSNQYWNSATPLAGVINPHTGTRIRIISDTWQAIKVVVE